MAKQELLATAKNLTITTPRTSYFTFYLKSTNLTTQVDPSSRPTIATLATFSTREELTLIYNRSQFL